MSVFESIERYSVEYLPTGDHALLVAWCIVPTQLGDTTVNDINAVLCLEDGTTVIALPQEFKFDFRYDNNRGQWVDVSGPIGPPEEGDIDGDTDPGAGDDGGQEVPGRVPETDEAGPGDPGDGA